MNDLEKRVLVMNMNKLVLNLRKTHRILTIPIISLMVLKMITENTAYGSVFDMLLNIGMLYMASTGLVMFIHIFRMKKRSKMKRRPSTHSA